MRLTPMHGARHGAYRLLLVLITVLRLMVRGDLGVAAPATVTATATSTAPASIKAPARKILFLGDSLTEGYGVAMAAAYPALIEEELKARGYLGLQVVNASISGSTSASASGRLRWTLKSPPKPAILVLALGANDGLRGVDPQATRKNLLAAVNEAQAAGIPHIIVAGMQIPTNYGKIYGDAFAAVFPDVAKTTGSTLLPFLLVGVAGERALNQNDGIHPNEAGHKILAQTVLKTLLPILGPPP